MGHLVSQNQGHSGAGKIFLVLTLCALSFLLHAWLRTKVITSSFEVAERRKQKNSLESQLIDLKVTYAKLLDDKNLLKLKQNLGRDEEWKMADVEKIIFLEIDHESPESFHP